MKKLISLALFLLVTTNLKAQEITIAEPEFINCYCILTSDSTYETLPKENGDIQKHQNKVSKFAKIAGGDGRIRFRSDDRN